MGWGRIGYYNNKRISHDGIQFRSKDEVHFWEYCKKKKAKGEILNFEYEPETFTLIPKFNFAGRLIRAMTYCPDFKIYHHDGTVEYIEVKGLLTPEALLKVKLFRYHLYTTDNTVKYRLLSRNLKHATIDGEWIEYEDLKKARAKK